MNWKETTLSTTQTIARWEKEVNLLAGYTQHDGLYLNEEGEQVGIGIPDEVASVVLVDSKGFKHDAIMGAEEFTIPSYMEVAKIMLYGARGELLGVCNLREGRGNTLKVDSNDYDMRDLELPMNLWAKIEVDRTWQDKIDLARMRVENDILNAISATTQHVSDETALNLITNPDTFLTACDMKALELIYFDLGHGTFNAMHTEKAVIYGNKYKKEMASALQRMKIAGAGRQFSTGGRIRR